MLATSLLDSAGIECFLGDDNLIGTDWFYSNAVGRVKLFVAHEDLQAAGDVLHQGIPEKFEVEGLGEYHQPKSPRCGSMDVAFNELDMQLIGVGMFVGIPVRHTKTGWSCHSCNNRWHTSDESEPLADTNSSR